MELRIEANFDARHSLGFYRLCNKRGRGGILVSKDSAGGPRPTFFMADIKHAFKENQPDSFARFEEAYKRSQMRLKVLYIKQFSVRLSGSAGTAGEDTLLAFAQLLLDSGCRDVEFKITCDEYEDSDGAHCYYHGHEKDGRMIMVSREVEYEVEVDEIDETAGADPAIAKLKEQLYNAIEAGKLDRIKTLVEKKGAPLWPIDSDHYYPLVWAITSYYYDDEPEVATAIVKYLVDRGSPVQIPERPEVEDSIIRAIEEEKVEYFEILLPRISDVDYIKKDTRSPLMAACDHSETLSHVFEFILSKVKNVSLANSKGIQAIHHAAERGIPHAIDALIGKGADINAADNAGKTPLLHAIDNCRLENIKKLLELGANIKHEFIPEPGLVQWPLDYAYDVLEFTDPTRKAEAQAVIDYLISTGAERYSSLGGA